jgi:hypothetical protein
MRGRFCTQPFLVERGSCRPAAFLLPLRWVSRSPPHPPQCAHWGTYGLWWLRLDLTEQSPGLFDPQGEGFGRGCVPFRLQPPPFPARPAGGRAVTGVGSWAAGQAKKEGGPPQGPPKPEKVGPGRKNLFLPGVLSSGFLQRKPGSPAGVGGGNHVAGPTLRRSRRPQTWPPPGRRPTGRYAPRPVKAPPTWRVPIISPVAFLSRAPQNTARPPPAGWPPVQSTPRPPRLGGSSRPSPARGRRR